MIVLPFFFHLIRGLGLPVAAQVSDSPLPSLTVLSLGSMITVGDVPKSRKIQNWLLLPRTVVNGIENAKSIVFVAG